MPSFRYAAAGPLRWQEFDGEWVVYCTTTGALQAADALTAAVLSVIECSPSPVDDVVTQVSASTAVAPTPQMRAGMSKLLDELERVGMLQSQWR